MFGSGAPFFEFLTGNKRANADDKPKANYREPPAKPQRPRRTEGKPCFMSGVAGAPAARPWPGSQPQSQARKFSLRTASVQVQVFAVTPKSKFENALQNEARW